MQTITPVPAGAAAPSQLASALYPAPAALPQDNPPAEVKAVRDADPARRLYDDRSAFGTAKPLDQPSVKGVAIRDLIVATTPNASEAQVIQSTSELAGIAVDVGLNRQDVENLTSLAKAAATTTPTAESQRVERLEAINALRAQYGDAGLEGALVAANRLMTRDPRLQQLIKGAQLANNPKVVLRFAELGLALKRK